MENKRWIGAMTALIILLICAPCHAGFYRYSIDDMARKAKARIQKIEKKIAEEERAKELQNVLTELKSLYEKAESLFAEKKYDEAAVVYRQIDEMSRDPKVVELLGKKSK